MPRRVDDRKALEQLRQQLQPILKQKDNELMQRIQSLVGAAHKVVPNTRLSEKQLHDLRVQKYL